MASSGTGHIPSGNGAGESETTIEIKIKTLDAQTYTLRVDKQMPVPALKEQIASVTGVLSDQQRLICRGKVLKDDQLLSAYHVEDGHTLHMVVREPGAVPPSSEGLPNLPGIDSGSTSRHTHQIAPGIVIETFSLPGQAEGAPHPPEISRILSAVLGSMGFSGNGNGFEGIENRENGSQPEQTGSRASSGFSMGGLQPPVIPDSLATLTQFISNIRREFNSIGRRSVSNGQASQSGATGSRQGFPTPASLAEVIASARQLLTNQAAEALLQLEGQLEGQASVTNGSARSSIQSRAMRTGALVHNLGSFLLELGRTIVTLRMGRSPYEAVVNAGPAVFISPNGPNPIMVQPLPFQVGTSFGSIPMGAVQSGSGIVNGAGSGYVPRRIDIQIRRGTPMALANANREEQAYNQEPPGQRNPATSPGGSENPIGSQGTSQTPDGSGFASESDSPAPSPTQTEPSITTRSVSINILSAGGVQNSSDSEGQVPGGVMQFIRNFFPGGEIHVEGGTPEGVATGDNQAMPSSATEAGHEPEPEASEEGLYLSNLLRQIMPMVAGQVGSESESEPANASEMEITDAGSSRQAGSSRAGGSRRLDDSESGSPNSKRQKME